MFFEFSELKLTHSFTEVANAIQSVNKAFTYKKWGIRPAPDEVDKAMDEKFNGGKSFDFSRYNDRVKLGKHIIDQLYARK